MNSNYLLYVIFLAALCSCSSPILVDSAPSEKALMDYSEEENQIKNNLEAQKKSWNNGDIEGFMKHYWNDAKMAFVSKNDVRYGWQQTLEAYKSNYPSQKEMGKLDFEMKKLDVLSADAAYMVGRWHLTRDSLEDVGGHFSLIWKKINGDWVIVTDHTS